MDRDRNAPRDGPAGRGAGDRGSDPVLAALQGLDESLDASVAEEKVLRVRIRQLREARLRGASWRDLLARPDASDVLGILGRVVGRLTDAGAALRRSLAAALVEEGASTSEVAERFKVSRQRVFRLLHSRDDEAS